MPCKKETYAKIMARVRKHYPKYSLKRRKRITYGIIYNKKKKKK